MAGGILFYSLKLKWPCLKLPPFPPPPPLTLPPNPGLQELTHLTRLRLSGCTKEAAGGDEAMDGTPEPLSPRKFEKALAPLSQVACSFCLRPALALLFAVSRPSDLQSHHYFPWPLPCCSCWSWS